jgi:hypothetical protein
MYLWANGYNLKDVGVKLMKSLVSANTAAFSAIMLALTVTTLLPAQAQNGVGSGSGTFDANHPRRAEVLRRDKNINRSLNNNVGKLGGHFDQLKAEDRAIHQQERADAMANGGHITRGEKRRLNKEENQVRRQEHFDKNHR